MRKKNGLFICVAAIVFLFAFAVFFFMCWLCDISYKIIFVICIPMMLYYAVTKLYALGMSKLLSLKEDHLRNPNTKVLRKTVCDVYLYATGTVSPHYFAWIIMSLVPLEGSLSFMVIIPTAVISGFCFVTLAETIKIITDKQWPFWLIQIAVFIAIFSFGRQFAFSTAWMTLIMA